MSAVGYTQRVIPPGWPFCSDCCGSKTRVTKDPVYALLRDDGGFLTMEQILRRLDSPMEVPAFERHLNHLKRDFHIQVEARRTSAAYKLGPFKAFTGQDDHLRHEAFLNPGKIS